MRTTDLGDFLGDGGRLFFPFLTPPRGFQKRIDGNRAKRCPGNVVDFPQNQKKGLADIRIVARIGRTGCIAADIFEKVDDIHQRRSLGVAGKAVTAAGPANRIDQARPA